MIVFGYNFPHWKTQNGLINLWLNGYKPFIILQDKKELNFKQSNYRITPKDEYLIDPKILCNKLGFKYIVCDHDVWNGEDELGVILGARILKRETIERFSKGILNLHPGILPGNRGLDNLKHSLLKNLPIGVTAHFIDHRIDMGRILRTKEIKIYADDTIRDLYIRQRNLEQELMIEVLRDLDNITPIACEYSEKFDAVDEDCDANFLYELMINRIRIKNSMDKICK